MPLQYSALPKRLTGKISDHIVYLTDHVGIHKNMITAWQSMQKAALSSGLNLQIASGFRNFERQLTIWNNKYNQKIAIKDKQNNFLNLNYASEEERITAILQFSALPGASRHHWGTDIDVYAPNLLTSKQTLQLEPWEYQKGGPFEKLAQWLNLNCRQYGFYFPYNQYRGGVAAEPWHLSYATIAQQYQQKYNFYLLKTTIEETEISGKKIILNKLVHIYKNYIININDQTYQGQQHE